MLTKTDHEFLIAIIEAAEEAIRSGGRWAYFSEAMRRRGFPMPRPQLVAEIERVKSLLRSLTPGFLLGAGAAWALLC